MQTIVKCKCGRNTTYGVLCGFCSKNFNPRNSRNPDEIDDYDEDPEIEEDEEEE